ncbi:hypothetical protein ACFL23_00215 [Patescibacteria group bacterium]
MKNKELISKFADKLANRFLIFFSALITSAVTLLLLYIAKWSLDRGITDFQHLNFIFAVIVCITCDIIMSLNFGKYAYDTLSGSKFQTLDSILYSIVHSIFIFFICSLFVSATLSIVFAVISFITVIFIQFFIRIKNGEKINLWPTGHNKLLFSI